jgi:hypothetical protein
VARRFLLRWLVAFVALIYLPVPPAEAQLCTGSHIGYQMTGNGTQSHDLCSGLYCGIPVPLSPVYSFDVSGCNPASSTCGMRATVDVEFPGNRLNCALFPSACPGGFYSAASLQLNNAGGYVGSCGAAGAVIHQDLGRATVTHSLSCSGAAMAKYSLVFTGCPSFPVPTAACEKSVSVALDFAEAAGCPNPPLAVCGEPAGSSSGAAGLSCPLCQSA